MSDESDVSELGGSVLLAVGLMVAAAVALLSFAWTVAPAGLESDPHKGATYKQISGERPEESQSR